jgi:CheY-like chemotaxis protein
MPGVDGLALAGEISQSPQLAGCRVVLMTSEDCRANRAQQKEVGISAAVTKPIQKEELVEIISRVLAQLQVDVATEKSDDARQAERLSDEAAERPLRVLVAEDNEFNQQVVQHLLARKGHQVRIATTGQQTLAELEQGVFDLLLLDIHMPETDGLRVIEILRQRERGGESRLPVIALTALSMKGDRERCLEAGMDEYLSKPIRRKELFDAIERVTAGRSSSRAVDDANAASGNKCLDGPTLLAACDGDSLLLKRMIGIFQSEAPRQLQSIEAAIRERNASGLRMAAHKLLGLVSALSPGPMSCVWTCLELSLN